ncbi:hypothetical protein TH53_01605 [Pedobacter lusitanus]|uniref:Uncharacterized protein n=1 Tax=Pedobacter lusitanus TaxID=1503925 RepID=A0A0D0FAH5_9SPHI|nr:hypothetical protein [Pedobacter lusitanus]KIO78808.1 hypothetical protein TH53_01605 [Pedobacter lusitanus]
MKTPGSIKLKAVLLIIVFFLNTVVGFACAIGTNMGFNQGHHPEGHPVSHQHDKATPHHHHTEQKTKSDKDNCCKEEVSKLTAADKETQSASVFSFQLSFSGILPAPVYLQNGLISTVVNIPNIYFARLSRAPAPDIRIAIRSFQI